MINGLVLRAGKQGLLIFFFFYFFFSFFAGFPIKEKRGSARVFAPYFGWRDESAERARLKKKLREILKKTHEEQIIL